MSDDREARVEELFARAVVLPRAERRTFIEKHCDDPGVRAEVEVLLGYDDDRERLVGVFPTASSEPSALPPRSPSPSSPSSPASVDYGRFMPGSVVAGRYRIAGLLGRGGVGEVYRADDLKLGQAVALKFLPEELARDPRILERFHSEVRLARQVSHPGVCRVHDIGEVGEQHFLSMEYIDGEDLASLLKRIGRFSREKALEVAHQLCLGVEAAHRKGVIHRDLKPANVMFDGRGRVVITDFGLAGIADEIPRSDIRAGTPSYMSPEQIEGKEVTTRSDIYALGLILYEVFTGEAAFDALPIRGLSRSHKDSTPRTPSSVVDDVPAEVEGIILRCLERDPESRPASALEVATALPGGDPLGLALAAGDTPTPEMVAASGRIAESRVGVICAALAFVAIGLAVIALTFRGTSLVGLADLPDPPPVLAGAARDLIAALGHESSLAFEAYGLEIDCHRSTRRRPWRGWPASTST